MGAGIEGRPTRAEIDLGALTRNLAWVRRRAGPRRVIGVVKADAYGHGAPTVARRLEADGCDALAVASLEEARELREAGVGGGLLLLQGVHDVRDCDAALELDAILVLADPSLLAPLEAAGQRAGRPAPVHLKFDTGMGRLGLRPEDAGELLVRVHQSPWLDCRGLMSHLAEADDPASASPLRQRKRFAELVACGADRGLRPEWIHMDGSAGLIHGPTPGTTAVRIGLLLYGADPTLDGGHGLEPVMTLCTRVLHRREVPKGARIGYGATFTTERTTRLLCLPIGYADGLPRAAGGRFRVGWGQKRLPLVGRVSMDLAIADAGPDSTIQPGEEILIFGRKGDVEIRVEELAAAVGTIAYEILAGVGPRVPRVLRAD
ncbi:MAG: alanine racemase [Myxococcota bacterium]